MDNCFILLGLSFDPIEEDESIINEAIDKKVQQWQNESKNPRKAIIAKEKIAQVPEIKKIMFNPELRQKEANKAKEYKQKILKDIHYDILIKTSKGTIFTKEIDEIYDKYKSYDITRDEILSQINVPIDKNIISKNEDNFEIIDSNLISQLETYFENLLIDDMSLYKFLNAKQSDSIYDLTNLAEKKLQFLLQKGEKSTVDEMEQKIAGIAKKIFLSLKEKQKYDNYLSGSRYAKINRLLRDGIKSNNDMLNINLYKLIIEIMKNEYGIEKKEAIDYVNNFCKINKIEFDTNMLFELLSSEPNQNNVTFTQQNTKPVVEESSNKQSQASDKTDYNKAFKKKVKPIQDKINEYYSKLEKEQIELEKWEDQYIRCERIPNRITLVFYLIILVVVLLMNSLLLISYASTMHRNIKMFIIVSTIAIIIDGTINIVFLNLTNKFYKYKNLMSISLRNFNITVQEKFNNHNITTDIIKNNPDYVDDYFDEVFKTCKYYYNSYINFKVLANNTLCKFNIIPNTGLMLGKRIVIVTCVMGLFYFVVFKFFLRFL